MGDLRPEFVSYAAADDPGRVAFCRRLSIASMVVGAIVVLANIAILVGGWDDFRVSRAIYGPSSQMTAGFAIMLTEAALSVLAGVYLLLAARLVRHDTTAGLRRHRGYALAKLVLAAFAAVGGVVLTDIGDHAMVGAAVWFGMVAVQFAISAAYPLTIWLLLRSRSIRQAW
jgi:hypothetical protein